MNSVLDNLISLNVRFYCKYKLVMLYDIFTKAYLYKGFVNVLYINGYRLLVFNYYSYI